jgi:hypothetical protein
LTSAKFLSLYRSLSPEEQRLVREELLRSEAKGQVEGHVVPKSAPQRRVVEDYWVTLGEAAANLLKSKSQVSRDAKAGRLLTNGKRGRHLRIFRFSVAATNHRMALHYLKQCLHAPPCPEALCQLIHTVREECCFWLNKFGRKIADDEVCRKIIPEKDRRLIEHLSRLEVYSATIRELISFFENTLAFKSRLLDALWDKHRPQ